MKLDLCPLVSDYIWQVEIKPKGLGVSKHLCGGYRFCLQDTVCFVRNNSDKVDFEIQVGFALFYRSLMFSLTWVFSLEDVVCFIR